MNQSRNKYVSLSSSSNTDLRRVVRVFRMVNELHKIGYQGLRLICGFSPSGFYWRCFITSIKNISKDGLRIKWKNNGKDLVLKKHNKYEEADIAFYPYSDGNDFFGLKNNKGYNARELATHFQRSFPKIIKESNIRDWQYAGWFTETLGLAEHGKIPIFFEDMGDTYFPCGIPPRPQITTSY